MQIFFSHATCFDFENELYIPIKDYFKESEYNFFLPEEHKINTKEIIKNSDLFFCEISYLSVGGGIETGWADAFGKTIFCFYKKGEKPSSSFKYLTNNIYEYSSTQELLKLIEKILKEFKK